MKPEELLDSMEFIDADLIERADLPRGKERGILARWSALAACLCLVVAGVFVWRGYRTPAQAENVLRHWSEGMPAEDYFADSGASSVSSATALVMPPYAAAVTLNGERNALEAEGVLPVLPDHPDQSFQAEFNGDGSLYKVWFLWMRRSEGSLDGYSDLKLTAAPRPIHEVSDVVPVYTDGSGNVIVPGVTVTERDGVYIAAEGSESSEKTLTWQTDRGWYQLSGSWNDSFSDLAALLDWFWAHPLSLERFAALGEETLRFASRAEYPEAFAGQIPDFDALGYVAETECLSFAQQDGTHEPVWFEGVYTRGETRVRWSLSAGADRDAWDACLGRPREIMQENIAEALKEADSFTVFFDAPLMAMLTMEQGGAVEAWEIIRSLQG